MDYIGYLDKDRDSDFGVSFPDFPGCVTAGKTLEEARRMAAEALALHIAGTIEDGDVLPDPSNLDVLGNDPNMRSAVAVLVGVEPAAEKTVRINITACKSSRSHRPVGRQGGFDAFGFYGAVFAEPIRVEDIEETGADSVKKIGTGQE
jgi:predicted RNase H-like HicB family nuclease